MACTPPTSASEVFCRAAKCNRWTGRLLLLGVLVMTVITAKGGLAMAGQTGNDANQARQIVGFLATFVAQFTFTLMLFGLARRRLSAAHHARVKANNLKALELLAASATDEATKRELLGRAADLVAGKPGCCK